MSDPNLPPQGEPPIITNVSPTVPPIDYAGGPPSKDEQNLAMLAHVLTIVAGFVAPLVIWLMKKDQSKFVEDQAKESLNFQITLMLAYIVGIVTACFVVGYFIIMAAWIGGIVLSLMAAMAVNKGQAYRYPFALRLVQ